MSVVIPSRRGGAWLEEAVRSVFAQTYDDWELLIIDNGMEHALPAWIVDDARVRVLREERTGVSFARNAGIVAARGELLALLDDDDCWAPQKLEVQVQALLAHPGVSLCGSAFNIIDATSVVVGSDGASVGRTYEKVLRSGRGFMPSTVVTPLGLVRAVGGFDVTRQLAEDFDLFLRLLDTGPALVLDERLANYRHHDGNSSRDYLGMCRSQCELLRTARREARASWRVDRILYSLSGEWVTRLVWAKVAFRHAGKAVLSRAPFRVAAARFLVGLRLNPTGAPAFVLELLVPRDSDISPRHPDTTGLAASSGITAIRCKHSGLCGFSASSWCRFKSHFSR